MSTETHAERIDGTGYSEALKLTACADLTIANKTLIGGHEDWQPLLFWLNRQLRRKDPRHAEPVPDFLYG